jgi:ketol-acid reductoisomerase
MHKFISETAKYGDLTRGPRIVTRQTKAEMRRILKEIQAGKFARQWIKENRSGRKNYTRLMNKDLKHQIEKVGVKLRDRMPWLEQSRA